MDTNLPENRFPARDDSMPARSSGTPARDNGSTDRGDSFAACGHGTPVRRYGITGGIGSGKSHVCRMLEARGLPVFYCDDEAKRLLRTDPALRQALTREVGPALYAGPGGQLVKPVLAAYLCRGRAFAARIDAIVWPRVAEAFRTWCAGQCAPTLLMECALLFESGFDRLTDRSVLVSAPEETRIARLMRRDGVSRAKAKQWISLQMPEEEKRKRADFVIDNSDGADLPAQIRRIWGD